METRSIRDEELAARLRQARPPGSLGTAVAAAGGVLAVAGAFVVAGESGGRTAVNLAAVLLLLAGYALVLAGPAWTRPASLAAAVVAPLVLVANVADELDGRTAVIIPALLVGAAWLAMFLAPGLRGSPILAAGALLAGWVAAMGAAASTTDPYRSGTFFTAESVGYWDAPVDPLSQGELTLVYALVVISVAAILDRRGWHVLATPFIAVAVFLAFVGLSTLNASVGSASGTAVLVVAVGSIIAVVGGSGRRRGSTWIGTGLAVAGLAALVADQAGDATSAGVLMVVLAAALVAASPAIERAVTPRTDPDVAVSRPEPF